jgi:hypothetical protein
MASRGPPMRIARGSNESFWVPCGYFEVNNWSQRHSRAVIHVAGLGHEKVDFYVLLAARVTCPPL